MSPPGAHDDTYIGICGGLGLWRIVAPPVDRHGAVDSETGLEPFYLALAEAAEELRPLRPDVAEAFARLVEARDD